jgi:isocitrate dehydrogenase (NAD+)
MSTRRRVTLIPGDGIGPEITEATVRILDAAGAPIEWERVETGIAAFAREGTPLPESALESIRRNQLALKARIEVPETGNFENPNITLRKALDLYANVRPIRTFPGHPTRYPDLDLVVIRENTEGEYSGLEHQIVPGVVESIKVTTEGACMRIARFAFDYATHEQRKKVTAVHKANIMKLSDGLFLECCRSVAKEFPALTYQELIVDNTCMQLIMNPYQFDVMVMQNFYGDLVSGLCNGLVGGISVVAGANLGGDIAVFEAIHGDAPHLVGKNAANPMPMLVAAILLLRHIDRHDLADRITAATAAVLVEGRQLTRDLGGTSGTREMADAIIARLAPG